MSDTAPELPDDDAADGRDRPSGMAPGETGVPRGRALLGALAVLVVLVVIVLVVRLA